MQIKLNIEAELTTRIILIILLLIMGIKYANAFGSKNQHSVNHAIEMNNFTDLDNMEFTDKAINMNTFQLINQERNKNTYR